jgi:hypothetical protein
MELGVRMMYPEELACYAMRSDGEDRCRVAFAEKENVVGKSGLHLNGAIVRIGEVFLPDNENRTTCHLYYHN